MNQQHRETNGLAIAGLVFSTLGWLTCGLLCPVGLVLSCLGLTREPRGVAIGGAIVGGVGSLFLVFVGFAIIASLVGGFVAIDEAIQPEIDGRSATADEMRKLNDKKEAELKKALEDPDYEPKYFD